MKTSTNALTKRFCAQKGWLCDTVQRFYGGKRHDLFGIADSIILKTGRTIFAQNCSYGSLKAHRDYIDSDEATGAREAILAAGAVVALVEWRRKKAKRGGKRMSRMWWVRQQTLSRSGWGELSDWEGPYDFATKPKKGKAKRAKFEPTYNLVDIGSGGGLDYAGLISGHGYDS